MKTRKTRLISLLAVATLLITCFCSTLSVSAERYTKTESKAMESATIKFVGIDANGNVGAGKELVQTLSNYNDYNSDSNAKGLQTSGYWVLIDRYMGLTTDVLMDLDVSNPALLNPTTVHNYVVVEWNNATQRFEVTQVYPAGTRRVLPVPRYGFALIQYNTFGNATKDAQFFNNLPKGTEVQVNLDDMMALLNTRQTQFNYEHYEQMILSSKVSKTTPDIKEIVIKSKKTYVSASANTADLTGAEIKLSPEIYNEKMYNDQIALYDASVANSVALPTSGRGHYIPLVPVEGKSNVYKVQQYTIPGWKGSPAAAAPTKASIPEGGYLLCMTHFMSSSIKYGAYGDNNKTARALFEDIAKYFAVGEEFEITITPTVDTKDEGAVRFGKPTGLRFKTQISSWNALINRGYTLEAGTLIMPKDLLEANGGVMTIDALGADKVNSLYLNVKQTQWAVEPGNSTVGEMWAALVNIKAGNYGRQFAARGYVKATKDGVSTYYYSDATIYRSVRAVADAALADPECDTKYTPSMKTILQGFATPAQS